MNWPLRAYRPDDAEALAALFRASARVLGAQAYSSVRVDAWRRDPEDLTGFRARLAYALDAQARRLGTTTLRAAASRLSKPFFEKNGWTVVEIEQAPRYGVVVERYLMENPLGRR